MLMVVSLTALTLKWGHIVTFIVPFSRRLYYWYYVLLVVFDTLSPPPPAPLPQSQTKTIETCLESTGREGGICKFWKRLLEQE